MRYSLRNAENWDRDGPFNLNIFDSLLVFAITIRKEIHENVSENIQKSEKNQTTNYDKPLQPSTTNICLGDEVLQKNNKQNDRKGVKFCLNWLGPYRLRYDRKQGWQYYWTNMVIVWKRNTTQWCWNHSPQITIVFFRKKS